MEKGRRYDQEYKDMKIDLYKLETILSGISGEYGIEKSTIKDFKYIL